VAYILEERRTGNTGALVSIPLLARNTIIGTPTGHGGHGNVKTIGLPLIPRIVGVDKSDNAVEDNGRKGNAGAAARREVSSDILEAGRIHRT
jgi:hypothetical protein